MSGSEVYPLAVAFGRIHAMETATNSPNSSDLGNLEHWESLINQSPLVLMELQKRRLRQVLLALAGESEANKEPNLVEKVQDAVGLAQHIQVEKTVTINKSAEELYDFWRNFENLPAFMKHIKSITPKSDRLYSWVANAPLGTSVAWDAKVIQEKPNSLITWVSSENSDIENSGLIRFQKATGGRGTEVKAVMEYSPLGGEIASAIAKLFGEEPEQQLGDELNRFKQLMEAGEIATIEGQPKGT
ncbi:MAG: SRPBCC family protein [Halothece sp.]